MVELTPIGIKTDRFVHSNQKCDALIGGALVWIYIAYVELRYIKVPNLLVRICPVLILKGISERCS